MLLSGAGVRICRFVLCRSLFTPAKNDQLYCSPMCRAKQGIHLRVKRFIPHDKVCALPRCRKKFRATVYNAKWCSRECRKFAERLSIAAKRTVIRDSKGSAREAHRPLHQASK